MLFFPLELFLEYTRNQKNIFKLVEMLPSFGVNPITLTVILIN